MHELVNGLAHLCSLRDRDALDGALVSLLLQACEGRARRVRLVQLLGDATQRHCLVRAERRAGAPGCERRVVWVNWKDLPALDARSALAQALQPGALQSGACHAGDCTVLPLGNGPVWLNLIEVHCATPLPPETLAVLQGILRLYQNFEGLLDYGEKDALTELLNRKTFDSAFAKAAATQVAPPAAPDQERRAVAEEANYWLAVLDIDHFKRVNDNFGHLIGDEVLLLMARLMRAHFRFQDQLYRFGGEEFVILMRGGSAADATNALDRFRSVVASYAFPQVGTITVSIGFACLREDDTPGGAFDRADKAVYYAKEHGRNQVCDYQLLLAAGELVEESDDASEVDFF